MGGFKKFDPQFPFSPPFDMKMRRVMIVGPEPTIQTDDLEAFDFGHSQLQMDRIPAIQTFVNFQICEKCPIPPRPVVDHTCSGFRAKYPTIRFRAGHPGLSPALPIDARVMTTESAPLATPVVPRSRLRFRAVLSE
jgi:hypothetical protein